MSADDLTETLAAIKSRNDFGELRQDDGDALLSAVEGVLALHQKAEYANRVYRGSGKPDTEWTVSYCIECGMDLNRDEHVMDSWPCPTVKALTDALGGEK